MTLSSSSSTRKEKRSSTLTILDSIATQLEERKRSGNASFLNKDVLQPHRQMHSLIVPAPSLTSKTSTITSSIQHVRRSSSDGNIASLYLDRDHHRINFNLFRHSMKIEALSNATTLPIEISQKALHDNADLGPAFGTTQQLRDVIGYNRRAHLNVFPAVDVNNVCELCDRSCIGKRGLAIHETSCRKKHRAS